MTPLLLVLSLALQQTDHSIQSLRSSSTCPRIRARHVQVTDALGNAVPFASLENEQGTVAVAGQEGVIEVPEGSRACELKVRGEGLLSVSTLPAPDRNGLSTVRLRRDAELAISVRRGAVPCAYPTVSIQGSHGDASVVDLPGGARVVGLAPGPVTLDVSCRFDRSSIKTVTLTAPEGTTPVEVVLEQSAPADPQQTAAVSGRVLPPDPAHPGRVKVACHGVTRAAVLHDDGSFEVDELPPYPRCVLDVERPGWKKATGMTASPASSVQVTLER